MKNLKAKVAEARKNCLFVDCGFWAGVTGENNSELIALANCGVFGFKAILNPQESYPDFPNLTAKTLKSALEILEETNCVFAVRLALSPVNFQFTSKLFQIKPEIEETEPDVPDGSKVKSYPAYLAQKPASIEKIGVQLVIDAVKQHKMRIHLTDVSSAECLPLIQKYTGAATPKMSTLSFETSLHYLALMSEDIGNGRTEFKCTPPVRNNNNRSSLWDAMKSYEVFNVSSSHTPSSIKSKCLIGGKNRGNFFEATNGIASLQFGLPVFWTSCQQFNMSIVDVHRFLSSYPAKLVGLDTNKARIQVGYDADFCIWDPDEEWTVSDQEALFKNKICPYFGKTLKGRVYATVVRGFFVYDANNPRFEDPMGNVLLKKPQQRNQRSVTYCDDTA